jgi:hypothetical protein
MSELTYKGVKYPVEFNLDTLEAKVIMPNGVALKYYFHDDTTQLGEIIGYLKGAIAVELYNKEDTGIEID